MNLELLKRQYPALLIKQHYPFYWNTLEYFSTRRDVSDNYLIDKLEALCVEKKEFFRHHSRKFKFFFTKYSSNVESPYNNRRYCIEEQYAVFECDHIKFIEVKKEFATFKTVQFFLNGDLKEQIHINCASSKCLNMLYSYVIQERTSA